MVLSRHNGKEFREKKRKEVEGRKNRTLWEREKDKEESALQGKTIPSVFVTGAKTVQSLH